jgi:cellulose synthase/poly-beta-1,6-N-acetylglucosamine synthase-like glycosyltransferase
MYPFSLVYYLIMQWMNIGIAYSLTSLLFVFFLKPNDLPSLNHLDTYPKVALLYTTCDDAIPDLILKLGQQTYPHCDVFILDDSVNSETIQTINQLAARCRYRALRRNSREGFKAGNLNNWLRLYGAQYDYFVVLDADSMLDIDFIERMLKYAEHPANKQVAIFQSKILPWNTTNFIPRLMAQISPVWLYELDRVVNTCGIIPAWGHNNLCRTRDFIKVNGFDEAFISEDYATALNLLDNGLQCKLVNVISYEAVPETVYNYSKRALRWAHQTMQLELWKPSSNNVPLVSKLHLFMNTYQYVSWLIYLPAMILAVWGYDSDFSDIVPVMNMIFTEGASPTYRLWPLWLLFLYLMLPIGLRLFLAVRLGVSPKVFGMYLLLMWGISFYIMFPVIKIVIQSLAGVQPTFQVTAKFNLGTSAPQLLRPMIPLLIFIAIMLAGLFRNPLSFVLNFPWLTPLLIAPLLVITVDLATKLSQPKGGGSRCPAR